MPRPEHVLVAGCLALVGLAAAALRLLKNPASRLSRFVDRNVLPQGVTLR